VKIFGAICLAGALTISASAGTVTLYDTTGNPVTGQDSIANFSSGGTFDGNSVAGPIWDSFMSDTNISGDTLTSVSVNLIVGNPADGGAVNVGLYSSASEGGLIANLGTILDSQITQTCIPDNGVDNPDACGTGQADPPATSQPNLQQGVLLTLSGLSLGLAADTQYYLGLSDAGGDPSSTPTSALWNYDGEGSPGVGIAGQTSGNSEFGQFSDSFGAYEAQILATDNAVTTPGTPEPASFLLFGGGALAIGLFRRKMHSN